MKKKTIVPDNSIKNPDDWKTGSEPIPAPRHRTLKHWQQKPTKKLIPISARQQLPKKLMSCSTRQGVDWKAEKNNPAGNTGNEKKYVVAGSLEI